MTAGKFCRQCGSRSDRNEVEAGLFNAKHGLCIGCDEQRTGRRLLGLFILASLLMLLSLVAGVIATPSGPQKVHVIAPKTPQL